MAPLVSTEAVAPLPSTAPEMVPLAIALMTANPDVTMTPVEVTSVAPASSVAPVELPPESRTSTPPDLTSMLDTEALAETMAAAPLLMTSLTPAPYVETFSVPPLLTVVTRAVASVPTSCTPPEFTTVPLPVPVSVPNPARRLSTPPLRTTVPNDELITDRVPPLRKVPLATPPWTLNVPPWNTVVPTTTPLTSLRNPPLLTRTDTADPE